MMAAAHPSNLCQEVLRWAEPDAERLAGAIFLVAIKGLGAADSEEPKGTLKGTHVTVWGSSSIGV